MSDGTGVPKTEIWATHFENMIRSEAGLPLRSHYGILFDSKTGTSTPEPRSRIIDDIGRSVYWSEGRSQFAPVRQEATINDGMKAENPNYLNRKNRYYY